jgi:prepilin-type N-terminal cleavage/methylation domain-containing protein
VRRGFSLLEVLVVMTILGLAIVTLMQLSSQGLRLLRLSEDYQQAVLLADRIARGTDAVQERVDAGQEGAFRWERRIVLVPVPGELTPGAGPRPHLYSLSVVVHWGSNRTLELASLRAVTEAPGSPTPQNRVR